MNYLFTICGRAGSKGFQNKNLKEFLDIPLVFYSLAAISLYADKYGRSDVVCVALNTDSECLIDIVSKQQDIRPLVIRRCEELSGDTVPKVSVIRDCVIRAEEVFKTEFDMVIDLDITSPLRSVEDIKAAIDKKNGRDDTDVVFSVTSARRNPYFNMVKEENGFFAKAFESRYTARQQAPVFYDMNASIYAYSPIALKNKVADGFFNDKADVVVMMDTGILDIDNEEDFELLQVIAPVYAKLTDFSAVYECAKLMKIESHTSI